MCPFFFLIEVDDEQFYWKKSLQYFDFPTGNSIKLYSTVNQFSGQLNFKPSRVL